MQIVYLLFRLLQAGAIFYCNNLFILIFNWHCNKGHVFEGQASWLTTESALCAGKFIVKLGKVMSALQAYCLPKIKELQLISLICTCTTTV